ncbi:MAG TPA: hemopexin repeat-containing protein [Pyrinomonadaceae bacterium]|nr:hemopexin repeat-containing protein [Pyrinomonadaceae bacterium]
MNERLINEVACAVVFVQGPGEDLTMSASELLEGTAEILDGQALLQSLDPNAEISFLNDIRIINLAQPIFPTAPWKGMPPTFYIDNIDAALWRDSNSKIYFFQKDQYIRMTGSEMDAGYPKPIAGNWHGLPPEFEEGIDAAFWRKSNGKIYMFKGNQYVRLTDTTVDPEYPKPIAGNWNGLPADFESGIDAAFMHGGNDKIYMFKGSEYVRLTGLTVDADYPKPIKGNFKGVPDYYEEGIMAAMWRGSNEHVYLFGRQERNNLNTYVRFADVTNPVDAGYPKYMGGLDAGQTEALWRDPVQAQLGFGPGDAGYIDFVKQVIQDESADWGIVVFVTKYPVYWGGYANTPKIVMRWKVGGDNFDRVFSHETGHMFGGPDEYAASPCDCTDISGRFFKVKNGNCAKCASKLSMAEDYPRPIAGSWHGVPASFETGIDAAVFRDEKKRVYMFKGNQYIRMTGTTMDAGYPKPIAGNWGGLPASFQQGIDAALFRKSNGKLYFFKGNQYARLTGTTMDSGYPKPIAGNWNGLPAAFQQGIDGAFNRTSNDKIYMFKGNQYCRLTETTVDAGYPQSISGNFAGLPQSFTNGFQAALMHDEREALYLFDGSQYVRMVNGEPCIMSGNSAVVCAFTPAHLGWGAFMTHVDAALYRGDNNMAYLFSGKWYVRFSKVGNSVDEGYPKLIAGNWNGLPPEFENGVDAALWRQSNQKTYFFKGNQYCRLTGSTVDAGYPKPIAGNWNGLPADFQAGIDAALWRQSNNKIYFFKGDRYVRLTETTVDPGYPKPIGTNWEGLPASFQQKIDAAMMRLDTGQIYMFSGRRYVRYTNVANGIDPGYPNWIDKNWMPFPRG